MTLQRSDETGSALVVAIMVVALMLMVGFATLAWADNGFRTSGNERVSESAFNLAEAVLKAQIREVGRNWPTSSSPSPSCSNGSASPQCPSSNTLAGTYDGTDYAAGYTWSSVVQDNGGPVQSFYSTALAGPQPGYPNGQPGYDANGDGKLWVRAEATVHGKTRRLLAEVTAQQVPLPFPRNTLTGGWFITTNQGNKPIVNTQGTSQQPGGVDVRCPSAGTSCLQYRPGQISPDTTQTGYPDVDAVSSDDLNSLRGEAQANGTYYATCPATLPISAAIVFIESGDCQYGGGGNANTQTNPGMLVINSGSLTLEGNFEFFGLVYVHQATLPPPSLPNQPPPPGPVGVYLTGTALIQGAVAVDGTGGMLAGSSGVNLVYDSNVFNLVKGYGSAELIPGSWRELGPN